MIELNKLTRSFHDQTIDNVEIKGKTLIVTLSVYELGKEYGYTAESEEADLSDQEERYRKILITFYNFKNINKDFKYQFDNLDIYETSFEGTKFTFWSYFESGDPNYLFFDAEGFDFEYFSSEEK
jgi:hypothetical protein